MTLDDVRADFARVLSPRKKAFDLYCAITVPRALRVGEQAMLATIFVDLCLFLAFDIMPPDNMLTHIGVFLPIVYGLMDVGLRYLCLQHLKRRALEIQDLQERLQWFFASQTK